MTARDRLINGKPNSEFGFAHSCRFIFAWRPIVALGLPATTERSDVVVRVVCWSFVFPLAVLQRVAIAFAADVP